MKKLNIGCGSDIKDGWINLDRVALQGVDIVCDISKEKLPFDDNYFDTILCQDVIEHINDYPSLLKDIHRILKPKGEVLIRVPHFTSRNAYTDPTHLRLFTIDTFEFFCKHHSRNYYFDFGFSEIKDAHISFQKRKLPYNHIIEFLTNTGRRARLLYEASFLRIFPAENIIIKLIK